MARELNERQQKFLEVLFEEAGGDVVAAKKLAGYSETTATTAIVIPPANPFDVESLLIDTIQQQTRDRDRERDKEENKMRPNRNANTNTSTGHAPAMTGSNNNSKSQITSNVSDTELL